MQTVLASKSEGDAKVYDLRIRSQGLSEHQDLNESWRQDVQQIVKDTEEQWRTVLQAAEEAVNMAVTQAALERDCDAFKTLTESVQSWIRDQKQKLMSLGVHTPFEERLQTLQVSSQIRFVGEINLF